MASTPVVFSSVVLEHWIPELVGHRAEGEFQVVVDPSLEGDRSMTLLRVVNGPNVVTLTPARAQQLSLSSTGSVSAEQLADRIRGAGITFNGPDYVYYLPAAEQGVVQAEPVPDGTRQLTTDDAEAFARFAREAPEADLDDAFVELDHWLVFGTFVDGRLAAAASMYPWRDTPLADLGVITLPGYRGRGLGRVTVRAMSARAIEMGYEPQYRCQIDNAPSVALARAAGFVQFGEWDVSGAEE
ncbi:GNAT family N-acetyltransferase [Lysobacter korlensis]|uniref:GNAT family N-acetyltransferase n=1 Tax=Lysobacter korlensis TaxID=553636 RepID=A0ABV6RWF3_9GAMM